MPRADMEARKGRICETCGNPIPIARRIHARFCSKHCQRTHPRMRAYQQVVNRRRLYGIMPEEFDELLTRQDGRCAICRADEPGGKGNWHVDHAHDTGAIRGLLCHFCNVTLGNAGDDSARLRACANYLDGFL